MSDILRRIYACKEAIRAREELDRPYASVRADALRRTEQRRCFGEALRASMGPAIIGEVKRASPSAGLLSRNFDPAAIAKAYDAAGVDCISVLTESDHFLGELSYLDMVRAETSRPLLRKDFLSTRYDIAQSAASGADAVLLIVAGLTDQQLKDCIDEAAAYALDVLVEVHDAAELARAVALGVTLIGINNRNLRTFETDLAVSEYLLPRIPASVMAISESGMRGPEDIVRLYAAGARGFLVGEALMRSSDPFAAIRALKTSLRAPATSH